MSDTEKQKGDTKSGGSTEVNEERRSPLALTPSTLTAIPVPLSIHEWAVNASLPFEIPYPALDVYSAICIGLTIDWQQRELLYAAALRDTIPHEHARAGRYLRPEDSLRHLLGRALLRRVAAFYGGADMVGPIGTNEWGKPLVAACPVGCNISHAGNQVWIAVSPYARVGLDVESAAKLVDEHDIAASFHPSETAALRAAKNDGDAIIRCWSRKESVSKAIGMGLSLPLDAFAVDCSTTASHWLRIAPPGTALHDWTTTDVSIGSNYVGALAIEGQCKHVTVIRLLAESQM